MKNINKNEATKKVLRKRTIAILSFSLGILAALVFVLLETNFKKDKGSGHMPSPDAVNFYQIKRLKGFKNIQPVVSIDTKDESAVLAPTKDALLKLLDSLKTAGVLTEASIFFQNLQDGEWISINKELRFHPASLMKVPLMLAVLKTAEGTPGLLEKKITFEERPNENILPQHFTGPSIEFGKPYTVHDLIFYCAANSDNRAAHALEANINLGVVLKIFEDIGLPVPDLRNSDFTMTVQEFSMFMVSIYNSTFLSPEYSEYAAEMLANCNFKEGFTTGLPKDVKSWHKFGEWFKQGADSELHESGTIFLDGKPFLLTVMTRGKDLDQLTTVLQKAANLVAKQTIKHGYGVVTSKPKVLDGC